MLKRAHGTPRLILNEALALSTDTSYRIRLHTGYQGHEREIVAMFMNSGTALCAELEGRHYGGGVLELVPSEIERVAVPVIPGSENLLADVDADVRSGVAVPEVLKRQDARMVKYLGMPLAEELAILHSAWRRLMNRRQRKGEE
jgi:hypothetical protein